MSLICLVLWLLVLVFVWVVFGFWFGSAARVFQAHSSHSPYEYLRLSAHIAPLPVQKKRPREGMHLFPVLVPYYACEGGLPSRTGAKASLTHCLGVRGIPYETPRRRRPNLVLRWEAAPPKVVFRNCRTSEMRYVLPVRFGRSPPSQGV